MPVFLVLLPTWLIASAGWAIWHYFHQEEQRAARTDHAFSRMVSEKSLADDVYKITTIIGERHSNSESAAKGLDQVASMIAGALGPSNTGLAIRTYPGPMRWPILVATIPGTRPKNDAALWVVAAYDSHPGSPGTEANATGVAAAMATAQQLAGDSHPRTIHFAFLPHGHDPESPILQTTTRFSELTANAYAILCVEAMGSGTDLWLTSRDTDSPLIPLLGDLGSVRSAEVVCLHDDTDLASILFECGRPAVRISTRSQVSRGEPDNAPIRPALLAASTGRLIAYLRLLAK